MGNSLSSRINTLLSVKSNLLNDADLSTCTLNVLINQAHLCYCIINKAQTVVALFAFVKDANNSSPNLTAKDLEELLNDNELLDASFENVVIALQTEYFCLVNNELNTEDTQKLNFDLCVPELSNKALFEIMAQPYIANNSILFAFPKDFKSIIEKKFSKLTIQQPHAKFTQTALKGNSIFAPKKMFLNIYDNKVEIVITEGTSILFANTFKFINEKDFLYHVLSTGKIYKFSFENNEVFIAGFLDKGSPIFDKLSTYTHRQKLLNTTINYELAEEIAAVSNYQYFNLFSL